MIRKAIIPAAGLGTRFLPATKALPKEMLPIVDKPTIQYIIEEAVASGIEDIIIISGRSKRSIEDHFDKSYELEETLLKKNKFGLLQSVQSISELANIHYIRQKEPKGLGNAVFCAKSFIGQEPFAVLLGDDIVQSTKPCLKQMMDVFNRYHSSIVGVQEVPYEEVSKYGIVKPNGCVMNENVINVEELVEKPKKEDAPSRLAILGRYILRPEIFDILKDLPPSSGGEIQLTDAINILNRSQAVLAYHFQGKRYDIGDKAGFIRATIDFALQRQELKEDVLQYLYEVIEREENR
ncbi:UTP--glucose-1-phosphate uridylyltransferase [Heyndrickxia shackletonii]|uniref:UTP--glucose-1-phosphate uridylyltransferase n=1 Tax=Heyndrickxia shackletonii TaxID=157838 RepID=A0A0Q3WSI8_9BACI|nr:UTP--glucose-1-phosphate uridylyltransferase GalU [Heyndrickxia shackletonii]KQL50682.1 UTP--glucose-1-phosphate uridylyltransferase [Heyndrickxia shackletonii]MBB2482408.1 UTP--glucose-1-phosphate uridylyltransferase GalU [Bacillus sp. APMAM]NEY97987.1 UTP--glucose-1-phosphate uridylyltransferase GalU [Heyndrickxia shackletonii]RTZ54199.1 UTP--glucose-1-phosphate uridylyltransferase GalU [Bacillus sp. SAJ1]